MKGCRDYVAANPGKYGPAYPAPYRRFLRKLEKMGRLFYRDGAGWFAVRETFEAAGFAWNDGGHASDYYTKTLADGRVLIAGDGEGPGVWAADFYANAADLEAGRPCGVFGDGRMVADPRGASTFRTPYDLIETLKRVRII